VCDFVPFGDAARPIAKTPNPDFWNTLWIFSGIVRVRKKKTISQRVTLHWGEAIYCHTEKKGSVFR
jgi:hypothetical protein